MAYSHKRRRYRISSVILFFKTLRARELFDLIVTQAHHNGEPGVLFVDAANRENPIPNLYRLESTNPSIMAKRISASTAKKMNAPNHTAHGIPG